jgi:fatty acid desaturase
VTVTETAPQPIVPPVTLRPVVFPTDRLLATGVARPELRAQLRRIANWRNALSVGVLWAWLVAITGGAVALGRWWGYALAFVAVGPVQVRFAILMHEAAHRLLFSRKWLNDWVGTWLLAYPAFVPISVYRRAHFAHHRQEFGPGEPDMAFYGGYPCTPRTLARRLVRDAVGISGWKNFRVLLGALRSSKSRRVAGSILGVQALMWFASALATGRWWIYPLLWWAPWMTQWRVLNRLRAIAEHGGMQAGDDRRVTTHHVHQSWGARLWLVPYRTGWHLAHHVDMGIPWRNLARFHEELACAGYVPDGLGAPSYRALWRSLASAAK